MKMTQQQLIEMEADGAKVIRPEPEVEEPDVEEVEEVEEVEIDDHDEEDRVIRAAESEAMRTLIAQNGEAMLQLGEAFRSRKNIKGYDAEVIRDDSVEGDYKPITHLKLRVV